MATLANACSGREWTGRLCLDGTVALSDQAYKVPTSSLWGRLICDGLHLFEGGFPRLVAAANPSGIA
jgi:hypothetical protein